MGNDVSKITITGFVVALASAGLFLYFGNETITKLITAGLFLVGAVLVYIFAEDFSAMFSYMLMISGPYAAGVGTSLFGILEEERSLFIFAASVGILIPVIFAILRALFTKDVERNGFPDFFVEQVRYLAVIYLCFIVYYVFVRDVSGAYTESTQFIPFATLAGYIEATINKVIDVQTLLRYLAVTMLVYVPYGYLVEVFAERMLWWVKLIAMFILPVFFELIQLVIGKNMCDVDDMFFGFVGALIGAGIFKLLNSLFFAVINRGVLGQTRETDL